MLKSYGELPESMKISENQMMEDSDDGAFLFRFFVVFWVDAHDDYDFVR